MDNECPGWDVRFTSDDPRPITDISWFEAVEFTRRYTEWLLKNRPDALPSLGAGRTGYLRLPTEAEWEYAARGGHLVTESEMNQEDFFPLNNRTYSDYAVYTGADAAKPTEKLAWIGTRCANPLGLFDTAGNAAEMLLDPFRFSIDFRLHGAAGGFVVKGGSYRKRIFRNHAGTTRRNALFSQRRRVSQHGFGLPGRVVGHRQSPHGATRRSNSNRPRLPARTAGRMPPLQ